MLKRDFFLIINGVIIHKANNLANLVEFANESIESDIDDKLNYQSVYSRLSKSDSDFCIFTYTKYIKGILCTISVQKF
jgi:hypothetical protein